MLLNFICLSVLLAKTNSLDLVLKDKNLVLKTPSSLNEEGIYINWEHKLRTLWAFSYNIFWQQFSAILLMRGKTGAKELQVE